MSFTSESHDYVFFPARLFVSPGVKNFSFLICLVFFNLYKSSSVVWVCSSSVQTHQGFCQLHLLQASFLEPSDLLQFGRVLSHTWHTAVLLESLFITQDFLCLTLEVESLFLHPHFRRILSVISGERVHGGCVYIFWVLECLKICAAYHHT